MLISEKGVGSRVLFESNYAGSQHCSFVPCGIFSHSIRSLLNNEQSDVVHYMYFYNGTCNLY